jgi:hypothetical protein
MNVHEFRGIFLHNLAKTFVVGFGSSLYYVA